MSHDTEKHFQDRHILAVDGTSVQLADTEDNQAHYPQSSQQKPGCGFPAMQLIGLFDVKTGAMLEMEDTPFTAIECGMFQACLLEKMPADMVLLGDRAYGSFLNIALLQQKGMDALMRLNSNREWKGGRQDDVVVQWERPGYYLMPGHITHEEWEQLPRTLTVRYVRYRIQFKGFRSREIYLVTTLLDAPAHVLAELYGLRWDMEVSFRDIKTTLGMEFLYSKSAAMALKEVWMYIIAHNLIRWLMLLAAARCNATLRRLSFKGTADGLQRMAPNAGQVHGLRLSLDVDL